MARVPRIQVNNAIYYLATGGDNDEPIFKSPDDSATYLQLLAKYKKLHKFKLFAYCLAPGSIALLIEPSAESPISHIMHDLNSNYTKYFNRKYARSGHLFQERYRMVLVEKEPNLLNMTAYIHLRPKLMNPAYDIAGYKDSSYLSYLNQDVGAASTEVSKKAEIEGPDIGEDAREALATLRDKSYRQFVSEMPLERLKELDKGLGTKAIIGSDKFVQEVKLKLSSLRAMKSQSSPAPEEIAPAAQAPARNPMIKLIAACGLAVMVVVAMILFVNARSARMKEYLGMEIARKEIALKDRLDRERKAVYKNLGRKYGSAKASYQAMVEQLESENVSYRSLTERLDAERRLYKKTAKRLSDENTYCRAQIALLTASSASEG